jgi:hypothetical protein
LFLNPSTTRRGGTRQHVGLPSKFLCGSLATY